MLINFQKYDSDHTEVISNIHKSVLDLQMSYYEYLHSINRSLASVFLFKEVFGRQLITVNYERRNWIWTFSDDKSLATINALVSHGGGVAWEFNKATSRKDALIPLLTEIIDGIKSGNNYKRLNWKEIK
jgi:hypothetical protein